MEKKESIQEHLKKFKDELIVSGCSERTIDNYLRQARHFLEFIKKAPIQAERRDIISYMAYLKQQKNHTNASLALVLAALKFFFHTYLHHKIIDEIKAPKKAKKLPSVLTKEEVKKLLSAASSGRNKLIIEFLYSSGVRVSECVNMKLKEIDFKEGMAKVRGGKGNKDGTIILSKTWLKKIKSYVKDRKIESEYLFCNKFGNSLSVDTIQRIIKKAKEKTKIEKKVTPHTLRHSFGTHLLESGENIRKIQELLGHASLNTTQIYTHVSTEELKKVKNPLDELK